MNVLRCLSARPGIYLVFFIFSYPILAADADNGESQPNSGLEEVIVTATKQSQELSKVPISISAYTQDMMDARSIKSINDIVAQTPGVDLGDQGSNGVGDRISIRGIDSNSGSSTTGVYLDDTPIQGRNNPVNLGGTVFPEIFDIERVEVLRGPQGTLFGAGAEGGVVRFITPAPSLTKNSVYSRAELSSTEAGGLNYEAGAAFGGPLIDNTLGIRVSAWGRHDSGWVDRTAWQTGETFHDVNWHDAGSARIAVLWKPSDNVSITPSLLYQGQHQNDSPNYWTSLSDPGKDKFVSGFQVRQQSTEHFALPSLKVEVDAGPVLFTSITSYFYRSESNISDVSNYDIAGALGAVGANGEDNIFPSVASGALVTDTFVGATWQNIFTQELRLQNSDPNDRVRWVGGLFFQNSRLKDSQLAPNTQLEQLFLEQQGPDAFSDYFYDPTTCVQHCSGLLNGVYEYVGTEYSQDWQLALFGNVDWSITRQWILNAGLRVERTKAKFVAIEDGPVNNGASIGGGSANATPVTPKLGLSFQQDNDSLYYGSIAKGYRPGGGNSHIPPSCGLDLQNIGLTEAPNKYDSDSTWSYELGTKQRIGGSLSIDASVFYVDWRNIQWYYFFPNCGYGITFNLGHARSQGFDLEFNAKLTPQLLASLSIGYTDAKFLDTVILAQDGSDTPVVAAGQVLGQAPWTVYASLEYQFNVGDRKGYYLRVSDDYKSKNNGPYLYQIPASAVYDPDLQPNPASNQLDLRVGRVWSNFDISLFINNVMDATPVTEMNHYVGYDFNSGDPVSSPIFAASTLRPRTVGVTGVFKF